MHRVDFIIFSKNRPMQLRSLLESMIHFIDENLINSISVLFTFEPNHQEGYYKLFSEFPKVKFLKETNFRDQTISLVTQASNHVSFLVDDIIFYKEIKNEIIPFSGEVCFSLRLGKNCKYSHPANTWYKQPAFTEDQNYISWGWNNSEYDFAYPFSLDGHVFSKKEILSILESISFRNPNTLESSMMYFNPFMGNYSTMKMRSFKESCLVGLPINRVNNEIPNRFGVEFGINEIELQKLFDEQLKIDWQEMDYSSINGPHKEIQLKFKKL